MTPSKNSRKDSGGLSSLLPKSNHRHNDTMSDLEWKIYQRKHELKASLTKSFNYNEFRSSVGKVQKFELKEEMEVAFDETEE